MLRRGAPVRQEGRPVITADLVRQLIADHDANRPRSQQTAVGPSNLSSPCSRKLVYQLLDIPPTAPANTSLMAWVGTAVHTQMEQALADDPDWVTEQHLTIKVAKGITITGTLDAFHKPTGTVVDWKTVGPSALAKYRAQTPDNYLTQVSLYGLMAVMSGKWQVNHTAICYIPRNGHLADIHLDIHPWDQDRADAALRRLQALHDAAAAGPTVLPLIPTGDDCRYCGWWNPNAWVDGNGCPGHQTTGTTPAETQPNPQKETTQ
jgi:hypothetical protein